MHFKTFQTFNESLSAVDEILNSLDNSMKEYHESLDKMKHLQDMFVKTPKEKINERESLKKQLIDHQREVHEKRSTFHHYLAENGDGDIYNDSSIH